MNRRRPVVAATVKWLSAVLLSAMLLAGTACGGGDSEGSISQGEASEAANRYLATTLGLFTGTTEAQAFIDLFAPECRERADPSDLAIVMLLVQAFAPELQGIEIEDVDVGELELKETAQGTEVSPKDPAAFRIKVDGEFVPAAEFFGEAGFESTEEEDFVEPLLLVERDGEIYIGDCSELDDLSNGLDTSTIRPPGPGAVS